MSRDARHHRHLLTAGLVLATIAAAAGCTGDPPNRRDAVPSASASAGSQSPAPDAEMDRHLRAADAANAEVDGTLIAAGARPTVVRQESGPTTMVIRDEGADEWKAGDYRLVVNCAGSGTLYAYSVSATGPTSGRRFRAGRR